ncbi:hypothetical protein MYX78_08475 [Acidobacteria bacterium AH-259-G07]|nr:hypothetical protein [Acidobacteria bacterium AH-259-L09]MDA2927251.1 hypothetical protein [Acidobacteria bacterium AH-259-G07]MDA2938410.1 hypothetical protein [Acidobacteria bacterium AH-259-A15]
MMEEKEERIGIFSSWNWLYVTVIVYTTVLIVLLYLLTAIFDHSIQ